MKKIIYLFILFSISFSLQAQKKRRAKKTETISVKESNFFLNYGHSLLIKGPAYQEKNRRSHQVNFRWKTKYFTNNFQYNFHRHFERQGSISRREKTFGLKYGLGKNYLRYFHTSLYVEYQRIITNLRYHAAVGSPVDHHYKNLGLGIDLQLEFKMLKFIHWGIGSQLPIGFYTWRKAIVYNPIFVSNQRESLSEDKELFGRDLNVFVFAGIYF